MQVAYQVLKLLSSGQFCSGQTLSELLQVSRSRIWQAVGSLRENGIEIYAVPGRGYRLSSPLELLDKDKIIEGFSSEALQAIQHIDTFGHIYSTNDYILESLNRGLNYKGYVCLAEGQKKGRGRQGNLWYSPLAKNIYMSLYWRMPMMQNISTLSLVTGICVIRAINKLLGPKPGLGLKWPNDLWYKDSKLGGILIETRMGKEQDSLDVVIGIGCNINQGIADEESDYKKTSLEEIFSKKISRNLIISAILNELTSSLVLFQRDGFRPFISNWEQYDVLSDRMVTVKLSNDTYIQGQYLGISEQGALCVDVEGERKVFLSGEVQVRPYAVTR